MCELARVGCWHEKCTKPGIELLTKASEISDGLGDAKRNVARTVNSSERRVRLRDTKKGVWLCR